MSGREDSFILDGEPLWYKDAVIYEVPVRAYRDSDGDGIGDFPGLTSKLDYLQDLGVTAIWLLPFYPSPLRDDGYDIADYTDVHPVYGKLRDVRQLVREAHRRGIRVITELVCNHTSDQHPWFQRARRSPRDSVYRNFYVWSDDPDRYRETRIIFKDFETSNWTWDPVAQSYYWHRFYSHQPDLNFDSPQVRRAIFRAMEFWLSMGIDGMRLDAVPYLYEREGTNCENLPETHAFLRSLRHQVDERFSSRMLLAEANQWPEQAVSYFGAGDECHMAFHFPLMPRMFMAIRMEDRFPIVDILAQTPSIPESCQWALFLRNHDELTLEMVTDEERDYMYRVYARDQEARINLGIRRRLAPLLGNNRRRMELMNGLLFSLPGTPVIYYGDEIGMGDNIYLGDRNGVRTPMQWSGDRNAGFSQSNPQKLYLPVIVDPEYHFETVQVEAQQANPHSLLWWMKRLIALRKRYRAFSRGSLEFLQPENRKVLAFVRTLGSETALVVANLSRFVQYVELDMSAYQGKVPVEMFGGTPFPPIGELPYLLTLGPHSFYWFALEPQRVPVDQAGVPDTKVTMPVLAVAGGIAPGDDWISQFTEGRGRALLEEILPGYLAGRRWYGGKARRMKGVHLLRGVPVPHGGSVSYLAPILVDYTEGDSETYVLPLALETGDSAGRLLESLPHAAVARLRSSGSDGEGVIYDALFSEGFCESLLAAVASRRRFKGPDGDLLASQTPVFRRALLPGAARPLPSMIKAEQSNTSVVYGTQFIMKVFRRLEPGMNPDLELGRFLTQAGFPHVPPVAGALEYRRSNAEPSTLAILHRFIPNVGDAWQYTADVLGRYYELALASPAEVQEEVGEESTGLSTETLLDLSRQQPSPLAVELVGPYLESARLLGQRTAEMHLTLSSDSSNPDFAPEPFTSFHQRSVYQSMRSLTSRVFRVLRKESGSIPREAQAGAQMLLGLEAQIQDRFRAVLETKVTAVRIRIHGDYHLGQLLYTGKDFFIIDFEGEPARPVGERRIKRSPLRDVAGMLRSFHYASHAALMEHGEDSISHLLDPSSLAPWARFWYRWVSSAFLGGYMAAAVRAPFLPEGQQELEMLLNAFLLEKAVYELGYELNNRPGWVTIPIQGVLQLLDSAE